MKIIKKVLIGLTSIVVLCACGSNDVSKEKETYSITFENTTKEEAETDLIIKFLDEVYKDNEKQIMTKDNSSYVFVDKLESANIKKISTETKNAVDYYNNIPIECNKYLVTIKGDMSQREDPVWNKEKGKFVYRHVVWEDDNCETLILFYVCYINPSDTDGIYSPYLAVDSLKLFSNTLCHFREQISSIDLEKYYISHMVLD